MADIKVHEELCTGCEACLAACPFGAIEMKEGTASITEACNLCGACVPECALEAIEITKGKKEEGPSEEHQGVWVFGEQRGGRVAGVAFELLGVGRRLADELGHPLCAVLLGHNIRDRAKDLAEYGADVVYVVDDQALEKFTDDPYTSVMVDLVKTQKPEIVLFGATSTGRSLAPRIAARLQTGLTADCTGLDIDPESRLLKQTRPAFGGNIMATILCRYRKPQMATVRPKVMKKMERQPGRAALIREVKRGDLRSRVQVLEFIEEMGETVNLEDADIIVSGGRGICAPKNFALIEGLAKVLGGAVGASRSAVDAGWIPYSHQVGQTGKTVSPKVYIAVGISGAIQHLAGMQSSDIIVAINKNPDAPIFKVCTYGIVGDLFHVVPALTEEFKKALSEA
ncbi:MAG: electron transfer flavoprotein subunit alpha [Bacillota bacterium]